MRTRVRNWPVFESTSHPVLRERMAPKPSTDRRPSSETAATLRVARTRTGYKQKMMVHGDSSCIGASNGCNQLQAL